MTSYEVWVITGGLADSGEWTAEARRSRLHRIGQEHDSVEIIDVLALATVDDRVRELLREKSAHRQGAARRATITYTPTDDKERSVRYCHTGNGEEDEVREGDPDDVVRRPGPSARDDRRR